MTGKEKLAVFLKILSLVIAFLGVLATLAGTVLNSNGSTQPTPTVQSTIIRFGITAVAGGHTPVANALVSVSIPGLPPKTVITGNDGYAEIIFSAAESGQTAQITIQANGYPIKHLSEVLAAGSLPLWVKIDQ